MSGIGNVKMNNKYTMSSVGKASSFNLDGTRKMVVHPLIESEVGLPIPIDSVTEVQSVIEVCTSTDVDFLRRMTRFFRNLV